MNKLRTKSVTASHHRYPATHTGRLQTIQLINRHVKVIPMPRIPTVQNKLKILAAIITLVVIIVFMFESVVVQAGHRGVVLYVGAVENRVLGEGIHFIVPFAEQVVQLEVRTLKFQADATAASNDLQEVQTTIALNYHISPLVLVRQTSLISC